MGLNFTALLHRLAAKVLSAPTPAKAPRPKPATAPNMDYARAQWLAKDLYKHPAPKGDNVPRYSPPNFPAPIWSLDDLARADGRKFSNVTGAVLIKDHRPKWARGAWINYNYNKATGQYNPKRAKPL